MATNGVAVVVPTVPRYRSSRAWTVDKPPPRIRAFVRWYCHERQYNESYANYARWKGISSATIQTWMRDPRVLELLDTNLRYTNAGPIRVQAILDMLHKRAVTDEDTKAARIYLEAVDRLIPKRQVDVTIRDARGLSDHELRDELKRALQLLNRREPSDDVIEDAEVVEDSLDDSLDTAGLNP